MDATLMRLVLPAAVLVLTLSSCMKIYSESERPDLDIEWSSTECSDPDAQTMKLSLELRDGSVAAEQLVPCGDFRATFVDVKPARYNLDSFLLLPDGQVFAVGRREVDMRDAFDAREYVYFYNRGGNIRLTWDFANGATCASLGATEMIFDVRSADSTSSDATYCDLQPWVGYADGDAITVRLSASAYNESADTFTTRAVSEVAGPFAVTPDTFTDIGPITLTPCTNCD
jgi:hypothetical protein